MLSGKRRHTPGRVERKIIFPRVRQSASRLAFLASNLTCIATISMLGACSASPRGFDVASEQATLMRRDAQWSDLATAGKDVDKIVSYWSDDAVIMMPGQPVVQGKAAIRNYVAASLKTPGFKIHWVSDKPEFSPDGKLAYMRGLDEMTVPGANGAPMTMHLRGYSIWRLAPDGQWLCVVDISSEQAPTA